MQRVLSHTNKSLAAGILAGLRADLVLVQEAEAARLAAQKAQAEERRRQREEAEAAQKLIRDRRMPLAEQGLRAILALGASEEIQGILRLQAEADSHPIPEDFPAAPKIALYIASRPSGDAWDTKGKRGSGSRDVGLTLRKKNFYLEYGSFEVVGSTETLVLPYETTEEKASGFLESLYSPSEERPGLALRTAQWTYEWQPRSLAFQVLVDCADSRKLERHLRRGLTEIVQGYRRI